MKHLHAFIPAVALTLLVACGGGGVTPTPTPNPTPSPAPGLPTVPPDTTPTPTPTPTPNPDTGSVPYAGEWEVTFTADSGVSFVHSLNITESAADTDLQNGGFGLQRLCIGEGANPCDDNSPYAGGFGFIGNLPLDDGSAPLVVALFTQYGNEDPELKVLSAENMSSSTNSQGQATLSGEGFWLYQGNTSNDGASGQITAVNVGSAQTLRDVELKNTRRLTREVQGYFR